MNNKSGKKFTMSDEDKNIRKDKYKTLLEKFSDNIKMGKGVGKRLFRLFWLNIKLSEEEKKKVNNKIFKEIGKKTEYTNIYVMPYSRPIGKYELEDFNENDIEKYPNLPLDKNGSIYKKIKGTHTVEFDTTTGNIHPLDAMSTFIKNPKPKEFILVKNEKHKGVLLDKNELMDPKDEDKYLIYENGKGKKYYIPKICIYKIKTGESVGEAFESFLKQIGL